MHRYGAKRTKLLQSLVFSGIEQWAGCTMGKQRVQGNCRRIASVPRSPVDWIVKLTGLRRIARSMRALVDREEKTERAAEQRAENKLLN